MSLEQSPPWPLDTTRQIAEQATELDDHMFLCVDLPNFNVAAKHALAEFNSHSPLIGQHVYLYGTLLTSSINGDMENGIDYYPLANPASAVMDYSEEITADTMQAAVQGVYDGLELWPVYDPEFDRVDQRIVHTVQNGSVHFYEGPMTSYLRSSFNYVLVGGSEIYPVKPVDTHSYVDLRNDKVRKAVDSVLAEHKGLSKPVVAKAVGKLLNQMIPVMEESDRELNLQRLSYVNSHDLLSGLTAVTNDFVVGSRDTLQKEDGFQPSDLRSEHKFPPSIFDLRHGYKRVEGGIATPSIDLQLFLRHEIDYEDVVYAPEDKVMAYQVTS